MVERFQTLFWVSLVCLTALTWCALLFRHYQLRKNQSRLQRDAALFKRLTASLQAGDLTQRLYCPGEASELDLLAQSINQTLDKIELLHHANRHVSESVAHDLRTPLAELRLRLESLTVAKKSTDVMLDEIDAVIIDVDRVIMIFNALLRLAEIDHGARRSGFEQVFLNDLITEVIEFYQPLAELKGIALTATLQERFNIRGDSLLLTQALGNLVDNALKYTHNEVIISLRMTAISKQIALCVSDNGIGVPDADKPLVTERFYRSNQSHGIEGVGLGLSLVASVARLHGGHLELSDANPGLHATLYLEHS